MSYKSIVVHLDTSERARPRLELALWVAKQFHAHLTGMFALFTPEPRSFYVIGASVEYYRNQENLRAERRAVLEQIFHAGLARAKVSGDWIAIDEYANIAVPRRAAPRRAVPVART